MRATKIALLVAGVMTSASAMAATDSERISQLEQQLAAVKARQDGSSWTEKFKINGFASVAVGMANNDANYKEYKNELNWEPDSIFGLQGTFMPVDHLEATVQFTTAGNNDWDLKTEWAYLAYTFDNGTKIRGGKLRVPFYMYSDYLEVGYAYPFVRPSVDIYDLFPISSYTGLDALIPVAVGDGTLTFQPFTGEVNESIKGADFKLKNTIGMVMQYDLNSWVLRGVYSKTKVESDAPKLSFMDGKTGKFMGVGASYDPGDWFVVSELGRLELDGAYPDTDAAYLGSGIRIDSVTPYVMVGMSKSKDDDERSSAALAALGYRSASDVKRNSYSVGVRWDFMPQVALKFDTTWLNNFGDTSGGLPGNSSALGNTGVQINNGTYDSTVLYTLSVDAVF